MTATLNILCPVDFSEQSRTAVAYAAALADHFKAQLHVLNVIADGECEVDAVRELERFVAPIAARYGTLYPPPAYVVDHGIPGEVILRLAAECIDLVVIATTGAGASAGPYGSTTLHVMQHSEIPLLVLPPRLHETAPPDAERLMTHHEVVLAPVDFDRRALRDTQVASALAEAFGLDLVLLHVVTPNDHRSADEAEDRLCELATAARRGHLTETLVVEGDPADQISRVARARKAGLIVMGVRGDGLPPGAPPGSIAYAVLRQSPTLVFAVPSGRAWISSPPLRNSSQSLEREHASAALQVATRVTEKMERV